VIEFIAWSVRLRLADYRFRIGERIMFIMRHSRPWIGDEGGFDRLVDRLSPWRGGQIGYANVWLRRFLYTARSPLVFMRLRSLELSLSLLQQIAPYPERGRYEGMTMPSTRLKAEWLDSHSEYADQSVGDLTIYPLFNSLFASLDVPWSRRPESWIVETDEMGFVIALQYENQTEAEIAFSGAEYRFDKAREEDLAGDRSDEPSEHAYQPILDVPGHPSDNEGRCSVCFEYETDDEDRPYPFHVTPFENREGQPEFNGAFG
jgi:hypothetical protein